MQSKFYKTWEEYKAENPEITEKQEKVMAPKIQSYEDALFGFIMFLCA
ncbi:MAG: hypothetical protein RO469_16815 [Thermincola sp.]|nr:hypothetical protein [Thermincola sp.]MDT3703291.1 hypothetical protein [Thermincola sp.]